MAPDSTSIGPSRCRACGFEAPGGDDAWRALDLPGLGRVTQCPECESTDVILGR